MNCKQCGTTIPEGFTVCPNCGAQVLRKNGIALAGMILSIVALVFCWIPYLGLILAITGLILSIVGVCKRNAAGKGKAITGIILAGIAFFIALIMTTALSGGDSGNSSASGKAITSTAAASTEDPQKAKEAFIASCTDLDFKAIARNPDNYVGKNFCFVCYVSSARTAKDKTKYYITYAIDLDEAQEKFDKGWYDSLTEAREYSKNYDVCVWLYDNRNESDPTYVKILENDMVMVYGTFNGLTKSQNSLTGETGEEVSLDIKYVEILD